MTFFEKIATEFETVKCWVCGVNFALDADYKRDVCAQEKPFRCPNGCLIRYGEPPWKKFERELQQERQRHDQTRASLRDTEKSLIAQRGATTRIKNRVGRGVCPCCNRTFQNLMGHMKTKHQTFAQGKP